jgi:hypothetical protein
MTAIRLTVAMVLLLATESGTARAGLLGQPDSQAMQPCLVEVLHAEMLPIGPLFHHTVKATLLVTVPNRPPFQTTVEKVVPVQSPPPRQGQRLQMMCDPASLSGFNWFSWF